VFAPGLLPRAIWPGYWLRRVVARAWRRWRTRAAGWRVLQFGMVAGRCDGSAPAPAGSAG